ncbi:MAG TPA: thiamine pyrophosphate-dependent enzyme [Candidatus Ozemobacteraceae bacterium]|nr:thiamine pyrophosphate-dependent enzyme [Candidatus Ozemobacteraceae bacterium]
MNNNPFNAHDADIAWCPGCGNFGILNMIQSALAELELEPTSVVLVSGIGQAAKTPQYIHAHFFNGLHGRALPPATAIKASNPALTVIAESGDGDMYGEGGNHFIHTIRRNPDITNIVHDNMVYGLTKGQASPTSGKGFVTPVQCHGVTSEPLNPIALALSLNASFVARGFSADQAQTKEIVKKAIRHRGYALVDIFQPCITFNRVNTFSWFKEHTYYLDETHDKTSREAAFKRALETQKLPLGIFYQEEGRPTFEDNLGIYQNSPDPLFKRSIDVSRLNATISSTFGC